MKEKEKERVLRAAIEAPLQTLRLPITRYCLRLSGFRVRTVEFLVKS